MLETLHFTDDNLFDKPLAADEVEIKVHAVGVNFNDVMIALGQVPGGEPGSSLRQECAGFVTRVGDTADVRPGDRVCCLATTGAFNTYAYTRAHVVAKIPDDVSFSYAAALPVAFCIAHYALFKVAHLQEGSLS